MLSHGYDHQIDVLPTSTGWAVYYEEHIIGPYPSARKAIQEAVEIARFLSGGGGTVGIRIRDGGALKDITWYAYANDNATSPPHLVTNRMAMPLNPL